MSRTGHSDKLRLGFLETLEVDGRGFVGGLLVTNQVGRPLEFQCTTPVKPNRTQEILYGSTLRSWLLGELIGGTLLDRVSIKPELIVTSNPFILELRNHASIPVACTDREESMARSDGEAISLGTRKLYFHEGHAEDFSTVTSHRHLIPDSADLTEPLDRVREALSETVKTVLTR